MARKDKIDFLDDVHRQANCSRLVHDAALNALANPPRRIGRKTKTTLGVEFLKRVNQSEISLFDQIKKRNATVQIVLGNIDHQAKIMLDHFLPRGKVSGPHAAGGRKLLGRREQRFGTDLVQVKLGYILKQIEFGGNDFRLGEQDSFVGLPLKAFVPLAPGRYESFFRQILSRINRLALLPNFKSAA